MAIVIARHIQIVFFRGTLKLVEETTYHTQTHSGDLWPLELMALWPHASLNVGQKCPCNLFEIRFGFSAFFHFFPQFLFPTLSGSC